MQEDPTTCGYIRSDRQYEMDLHKKCNKDEVDLKQQVGGNEAGSWGDEAAAISNEGRDSVCSWSDLGDEAQIS